jgi:hypothetical protein
MRQTLGAHGDPVEREYSKFLDERLPSYAKLWSYFVGNDGNSQLMPVPLNDEHSTLRHQVNQFTYSCIESAIVARRCEARATAIAASYAHKHKLAADEYLDLSEALFSYYTQLGRVRDLVEKLGIAIKLPGLASELDEYFKQRSNVLHEARVPLMLTGDALGITPPEGAVEASDRWGKNKLWAMQDDLDVKDLVPLITDTTDAMLAQLESALARAFAQLMSGPLRRVADALDKPLDQDHAPMLTSGSASLSTFDGSPDQESLGNARFERPGKPDDER